MSSCDHQENIEEPIKDASNFDCKKNICDGLIITTLVATTDGIFFALRVICVRQRKALLVSMAVAYLLPLSM